MKRIMIGVIALSLILIVSCAKLLPSENVNVQNSSCPENQKMSYEFSGAGYDETGCKDIAPDAGKICQNNDDCIIHIDLYDLYHQKESSIALRQLKKNVRIVIYHYLRLIFVKNG